MHKKCSSVHWQKEKTGSRTQAGRGARYVADYQKIVNSGLSDKLLQYEMIKAQKEIALSTNTKVLIMNVGKGSPVILDTK